MTKAENFVTEHNGRFYVAAWDERGAQYSGPLTAELRRKTGCSGFFCRSRQGLPGAGGYSYATRSAALRRARACFCLESA